MNICLVTSEYHTEAYRAGGMGRAFGKIAHMLTERGHKVTVCVPAEVDEWVKDGAHIRVRRYKRRAIMHKRLRAALAWRFPEAIGLYDHARTLERILREVEKECPIDVVLSANSYIDYFAVSSGRWHWVSRCSCYWPFYVACNFEPPFVETPSGYLNNTMSGKALKHSTFAYAPSALIAEVARRYTGRQVSVLRTPMLEMGSAEHWAVVKEKYGLPENYLLFYGSHQGVKGPHILAEALSKILDKNKNTHAIFIGRDRNAPDGSGGMIDYLRRMLEEWPDRVHFLGVMEQPEAFALIKRASFVVAPSLIDNLPNAVIESMYFGKVVVSTMKSGAAELLEDGESGILVKRNDVMSLYNGLLKAITMSEEDKRRMGRKSREKVMQECNPERICSEMVDLFSEAAASQHKRPEWGARTRVWWEALLFFLQVFRIWKWGAPRSEMNRFHDLASEFLPDYDRNVGMVRQRMS